MIPCANLLSVGDCLRRCTEGIPKMGRFYNFLNSKFKKFVLITVLVLFSFLPYVYFTPKEWTEFYINECGGWKIGKYNVLLITVDDLRPDMTCFGERDVIVHSPSIDRLASKSLVLRQAFSQYPLCGPSRLSLFTGRRPDTTRIYINKEAFRTVGNFTNMFMYFKRNGYHTHAIGKVLHPHDSSPWFSDNASWSDFPTLFRANEKAERSWVTSRNWKGVLESERKEHTVPGDDITKLTLNKLRQLSRRQCSTRFFLATGFTQPHTPIIYPKAYERFYPTGTIKEAKNPYLPHNLPDLGIFQRDINCRNRYFPKNETVDKECIRHKKRSAILMRQAYYSSVSYVDHLIGRILRELEVLHLAKETIVALTSDHSYMLGEHGMWAKHSTLDAATRVPVILHIPGVTDHGVVSERLVELVDIFPTLVEATGLPAVPQCPTGNARNVALCHEGRDFTPLIREPNRTWKTAVFSQVARSYSRMGYSVRTETHRYTEYTSALRPTDHTQAWTNIYASEFYDHTEDPDENFNKADDPDSQAQVGRLRTLLHRGWEAV